MSSTPKKNINALYKQKVEFLNVHPRGTVHEVITKLLGANKYRKFSYYQSANMIKQFNILTKHSIKYNRIQIIKFSSL